MARKRFTFYLDDEHRHALRAIKERDGVLESEQIRRSLDDWIVKKGLPLRKDVAPKGERKRVAARRRS